MSAECLNKAIFSGVSGGKTNAKQKRRFERRRENTIKLQLYAMIGTMLVSLFFLIMPISMWKKVAINSGLGLVLLLIANYKGAMIGCYLPISILTVGVSGIFGVPGVLTMLVMQML